MLSIKKIAISVALCSAACLPAMSMAACTVVNKTSTVDNALVIKMLQDRECTAALKAFAAKEYSIENVNFALDTMNRKDKKTIYTTLVKPGSLNISPAAKAPLDAAAAKAEAADASAAKNGAAMWAAIDYAPAYNEIVRGMVDTLNRYKGSLK